MNDENEKKLPSDHEVALPLDAQLDDAALDGVVGGARPRDPTRGLTDGLHKCCW